MSQGGRTRIAGQSQWQTEGIGIRIGNLEGVGLGCGAVGSGGIGAGCGDGEGAGADFIGCSADLSGRGIDGNSRWQSCGRVSDGSPSQGGWREGRHGDIFLGEDFSRRVIEVGGAGQIRHIDESISGNLAFVSSIDPSLMPSDLVKGHFILNRSGGVGIPAFAEHDFGHR